MNKLAQSPKICKIFNRCLVESSKVLGIGIDEPFVIEDVDGNLQYFDNLTHFLATVGMAVME